jgi:hypothetical protein
MKRLPASLLLLLASASVCAQNAPVTTPSPAPPSGNFYARWSAQTNAIQSKQPACPPLVTTDVGLVQGTRAEVIRQASSAGVQAWNIDGGKDFNFTPLANTGLNFNLPAHFKHLSLNAADGPGELSFLLKDRSPSDRSLSEDAANAEDQGRLGTAAAAGPAQSAPVSGSPVSVSVYDRTRMDAWQWFAAPPYENAYAYVQSLVRIGMAQRVHRLDWALELSQPAVLDIPSRAVSTVSAQGQLGLGGTYYASNSNNTEPVAAFLKQGYLRYDGDGGSARLGRFEFFDGLETQPKNPTIGWLQSNRITQRLIANFGFSNAQRSFDGLDAHFGSGAWNITAMAARSDQGVFNMNGNPELNVDVQYLALTRSELKGNVLWRVFGVGYHDGRTYVTKTDNRALAVRAADYGNIRIGTYGGDILTAIPAGPGQFDFLFWGVGQDGSWGKLSHSANAAAVEGGYQLTKVPSAPWLRGGWFRSSGDNDNTDGKHSTFFQVLTTPRLYARTPFYNLMNNKDEFVQIMDKPAKQLALRADIHWLQLTSAHDLWYLGGGAFDNKVFGYTGRPANGATSLATVSDISADWQASKSVALNFYYGYVQGKTVVAAIYPTDRNTQFGYVEFVYKWGVKQRGASGK